MYVQAAEGYMVLILNVSLSDPSSLLVLLVMHQIYHVAFCGVCETGCTASTRYV